MYCLAAQLPNHGADHVGIIVPHCAPMAVSDCMGQPYFTCGQSQSLPASISTVLALNITYKGLIFRSARCICRGCRYLANILRCPTFRFSTTRYEVSGCMHIMMVNTAAIFCKLILPEMRLAAVYTWQGLWTQAITTCSLIDREMLILLSNFRGLDRNKFSDLEITGVNCVNSQLSKLPADCPQDGLSIKDSSEAGPHTGFYFQAPS